MYGVRLFLLFFKLIIIYLHGRRNLYEKDFLYGTRQWENKKSFFDMIVDDTANSIVFCDFMMVAFTCFKMGW